MSAEVSRDVALQMREEGRAQGRQEIMDDHVEGLRSDLDSALDVLIRRIKGEADLVSAKEWLGLNYRAKFVAAFPGEEPPHRVSPST